MPTFQEIEAQYQAKIQEIDEAWKAERIAQNDKMWELFAKWVSKLNQTPELEPEVNPKPSTKPKKKRSKTQSHSQKRKQTVHEKSKPQNVKFFASHLFVSDISSAQDNSLVEHIRSSMKMSNAKFM